VTAALHPLGSDVVKACLPRGQAKPFPLKGLSLMKGSGVNFSQISALLGQQARAATPQPNRAPDLRAAGPAGARCDPAA